METKLATLLKTYVEAYTQKLIFMKVVYMLFYYELSYIIEFLFMFVFFIYPYTIDLNLKTNSSNTLNNAIKSINLVKFYTVLIFDLVSFSQQIYLALADIKDGNAYSLLHLFEFSLYFPLLIIYEIQISKNDVIIKNYFLYSILSKCFIFGVFTIVYYKVSVFFLKANIVFNIVLYVINFEVNKAFITNSMINKRINNDNEAELKASLAMEIKNELIANNNISNLEFEHLFQNLFTGVIVIDTNNIPSNLQLPGLESIYLKYTNKYARDLLTISSNNQLDINNELINTYKIIYNKNANDLNYRDGKDFLKDIIFQKQQNFSESIFLFEYNQEIISTKFQDYSINTSNLKNPNLSSNSNLGNTYRVIIIERFTREKNLIKNSIFHEFKSQYLVTISHELCNPLNSLISSTEELSRTHNSKQRNKILFRLRQSLTLIKFFLKVLITTTKIQLQEDFFKKSVQAYNYLLDDIVVTVNNKLMDIFKA